MKTYVVTFLGVLLILSSCLSHAQPGTVPWSSFGGGFAAAFAGNTRVTSMVGQTFAGTAASANGSIKSGFLVYPFRSPVTSGIHANGTEGIPATFELKQNYPNPFNPLTVIKYTVAGAGGQRPGASRTMLVVYDVLGRQVATLVDEMKAPGTYEVRFDGSGLASGVYIYRFTAGSFVQTRKMILLK
jgi:hypothetical protein